jgi:hypothetical protein
VDRPAQLSCQTGAPRDLDAGPDPPRSGCGGDSGWRAGDLGPADAEKEAIRNGPSRPLFVRRLGGSGRAIGGLVAVSVSRRESARG